MSEMVERVARALCAHDELDWAAQADYRTSGSGSPDDQAHYLSSARAAIKAMLEPDQPLYALQSAQAWLERWGSHVGSCRGDKGCTCGLASIRAETSCACALIDEAADAALKPTDPA